MTAEFSSLAIYFHIPFCKSKCSYCDFNSYPGKEGLVEDYFKALEREATLYSKSIDGSSYSTNSINTVFIGGGTPSYIETDKICHLLRNLKSGFRLANDAEVSIECNPGTITMEKLDRYLDCGINRLSFGVQSFSDRLLQKLGRIHTVKEAFHALDMAFKAGFKNVNADLIFGIPGQTLEEWVLTLNEIMQFPLTHLSCYSLKIEEGTPLSAQVSSGEAVPMDDELDREMYHLSIDFLKSKGLKHYEISNFAIPGRECRHNLVYWNGRQYIGLGAGAHSFFKGCRYHNIESPEKYIDQSAKSLQKLDIEKIGRNEAMSEFMILGLRLIKGVNDEEFISKFGISISEKFPGKIKTLSNRGLVKTNNGNISLTALGLDLCNQVFVEFI